MTGLRSQATGPRIADGWPRAFWLWLTNPYDYLWIVHHHSMRPLNRQLRFALAAATTMMALGSVLALLSSRGPRGVWGTAITLVILVLQAIVVVAIMRLPMPRTARRARAYFVGLLIFGDLGVAAVMLTLPPLDGAFGCVLLALTSTICVYFVSARWVVAHLTFAFWFIVLSAWRVARTDVVDLFGVGSGAVAMLTAVCGAPIASHVAWTLLSADARQSVRDPLTGLRNRRGVEAGLEVTWSRARSSAAMVAVVVVDVDDFKSVNDTHGHDEGDEVLQRLAGAMLAASGQGAVVGRTGGEEFMAILVGTREELVERIDAMAPALRVPAGPVGTGAPVLSVSVSVGAAVIVQPSSPRRSGDDFREAQRRADGLMYEAKRAGGDRAAIADL
ncbi:GGDEF domain-containing protein [Williamsia serinedens]|uniref:Diguanylate cyclase (GGDEF) domain-containing protein n=1 Tax=Williamsia serinedens TaxID=391736 RepID=A0ABT1GXU0_9NOCA|nr:GGDEF domain-containing protein [Williamsia serinedens]MCP2159776.1 diguanylate cyclase (GGDEF) domain-containing protein [Williamsia serinedens]